MRILLAADLHYALPHYDWIASVAAEFDAVALAGDLADVVSPVSLDAQIVAVRTALADIATRTQLLVASGNHDLNARNQSDEKIADWLAPLREVGAAVDGDTIDLGGTLCTVMGWWDGPAARAEIEAQLAAVDRADRPWVWVYHSPPEGPLAWTGSRHFGDPVVAEWVERYRPTAVLTGHIHQAPFTPEGSWAERVGDTWLFNAGKQIGPVPAHVELDLAAGYATWASYLGLDRLELDAPGAAASRSAS